MPRLLIAEVGQLAEEKQVELEAMTGAVLERAFGGEL